MERGLDMAGRKLLILVVVLAISLTTLLPEEGLAGTAPSTAGVTGPQYMTVVAIKHRRRRRRRVRRLIVIHKHHKHHKHHKKHRKHKKPTTQPS